MKKTLFTVALALALAAPAMAGTYKSVKVCEDKALAASPTTVDCQVQADISGFKYFGVTVICTDAGGGDSTTNFDAFLIVGPQTGSTALSVPYLSSGAVLGALINDATSETGNFGAAVVPIVAEVGTIRLLGNTADEDITCDAWLHMAD